MALRLKSEQYFNCPDRYRRVLGSKKQLLVEEVGSGKRIWVDVELTPREGAVQQCSCVTIGL